MKVSSDVLHALVDSQLPSVNDGPERNWRSSAVTALRKSLLSKFIGEEFDSRLADQSALEKFLGVNASLLPEPLPPENLVDQLLLGELKSSLYRFWYIRDSDGIGLVSSLSDIFNDGRVGPGSSLGSKENDFYTKFFSSDLSTTSLELYQAYTNLIKRDPTWSDAEKVRSEHFGSPQVLRQSRFLFVPKRYDISRSICVEPNLNMFFQLGLGRILERRLKSFYSIDLSTQPEFNRELARLGSTNGSYATIDLSSASDSLSIGVLRSILPRDFFSWLMALRTPNTRLPDGRVVPLKMISTMGNGFTFPLETIIFTAVVDACYRVDGSSLIRNTRSSPGNFAVFGDDIIVRTEIVQKVMRLLHLLGFTVNASKTFVEGPFRESCGYDYFNGHEIRGVYIKSLETPQDRYVAINLLNDWSAKIGFSLSDAVQYLVGSVKWVAVPPFSGLDEGIHLPSSMAKIRPNMHGIYYYRAYKPVPRRVWIQEDRFRGRYQGIFNPSGLLISFIAGHIRSCSITLRQRVVRYTMKKVSAPFWDSLTKTRSYRRFDFPRWETAVFLNLYK